MSGIETTHGSKGKSFVTYVIGSIIKLRILRAFKRIFTLYAVFRKLSELLTVLGQ